MRAEALLAGRYRLARRLAAGGMGEVWLGRDTVLGRDVAVKLLTVASDADPSAVERFRREARTMAGLQHPNIVTIFDSGTHQGSAFIVMELLPGPTLAGLVAERGPLPEPEVARLGVQIAAGLAAAHRAGVVHRDLKPGNLVFSSSGALKIVDFGVARLLHDTATALTVTNAVIGSVPYLAPEQISGAAADERSDLYALGCVLVTMVTGLPPFTGEHPIAVLHQHVHEEPPLLHDRRPDVSPALESLVQRLLAKRPDLRPASASAVEEQLTRILVGRDRPHIPSAGAVAATLPLDGLGAATPPPHTIALPPLTVAGGRGPVERRGPRRAGKRLLVAALAVAAAVAAVLLPPLLSGNDGATSVPPASQRTSAVPEPEPSPTPRTSQPTPRPTPTLSEVTAEPRPQTPASTAGPRPSSPQTAPRPTVSSNPAQVIARVHALVDQAVATRQLDARRADDLRRRLDGLAKRIDRGGTDVAKKIDDLSKYLGQLVRKGELSPDAFRRIDAALNTA